MMIREEFYIPSSDGKSKIFCVSWKPECETVCTLQITHGMMEHILRYDEFATCLTKQGIWVIGHDHLGHGRSCDKEDLGFFGTQKGGTYMLKDIRRVTKVIEERTSQVPHFILGHSMGSFFLRRYLTLYGELVDGAIVMGTGDQPLPLVAFGRGMAALIGRIKGERYRSKLIHELVLGGYNRKFHPNRTSNDWLSRDDEAVDKFLSDSYCTFYFTCAAYRDFFNVILDLKLKKQFDRIPKRLPILFVSGEEDPVGGFGLGVRNVYCQFKRLGCSDLTLKLYPEARHEVLNEINRQDVYQYVSEWLHTHMNKASG